jgi:enoyl-CoA hydratase
MNAFNTLLYERTGRVARITLNRPARGNGITLEMPRELAACVEHANLDPEVHVIALSGNGTGFCGGYDLVESAEKRKAPQSSDHADSLSAREARSRGDRAEREGGRPTPPHNNPTTSLSSVSSSERPPGSPLDPLVQLRNHLPGEVWDPTVDYAMMSRNVRGFMSLFHSEKPVVCKVHGFCVAGGTDMALCSDLLVIADDAKIGYPPARVWGVPTTAVWVHRVGLEKAKRLLFTGDCLSGKEAAEWGLAIESAPPSELDARFEVLLARIARMPKNQLIMMKLLLNQTVMSQGLAATQILGTIFDGIARHTPEGYAFQQRAMETGFKQAVRERDEPFGDFGKSTFKG